MALRGVRHFPESRTTFDKSEESQYKSLQIKNQCTNHSKSRIIGINHKSLM